MDLIDAFEAWSVWANAAPRTAHNYKYCIRRIHIFGLKTLDLVDAGGLAGFIAWRAHHVMPGSVNVDLAALFSVLSYQAILGRFDSVLLAQLRLLKIKVKERQELCAPHLNRAEVQELCLHAVSPRAEAIILVACWSGLRAGELCRLRWEDIDFEKRELRVLWLEDELGALGRIKNYKERVVPLCAELAAALQHWTPEEARRGFVFPGRHGPFSLKTARRDVERTVRAAGYDAQKVTFHLFRHTRASWWLQGNPPLVRPASPQKVARWLGDVLATILRYYGGLVDGYDPECEVAPAAEPCQRNIA